MKRHRRTKAELLQDPEYCKKHGIAVKAAKPASKTVEQEPQPKKRNRRTKAELLQDPEYCKKHGVATQGSSKQPEPPAARTKPCVPKKPKTDKVGASILKFLPRMYDAWTKVQSLTNSLSLELGERIGAKELYDWDIACCRMEEAFNKLEESATQRMKNDRYTRD